LGKRPALRGSDTTARDSDERRDAHCDDGFDDNCDGLPAALAALRAHASSAYRSAADAASIAFGAHRSAHRVPVLA
jgi:hypothetical protein